MVRFRWQVAGGKRLPFTTAALDSIFRYSKGLPRMVCTLCNTALTKAFAAKRREVDQALVLEASEEMRLTDDAYDEPIVTRRAA
jgi:type II secretory pathway predicted ATPase ExeA